MATKPHQTNHSKSEKTTKPLETTIQSKHKMQITSTPDITAIVLALTCFRIPLTHYWYMKAKSLSEPWNIKVDPNYKSKVTIGCIP